MLCSTAEAQTKQNTFVSLWDKNKRQSLREETNSTSSVASLHMPGMILVLILDEQKKTFYPRNQTYPIIHKGGHILRRKKLNMITQSSSSVHIYFL